MKPKDRKVSPVADWVKAEVMGRIAAAGITFNTSRSSRGLGRRPNYTPEPDPLRAVDYTGNLAQDAATEITALEQG